MFVVAVTIHVVPGKEAEFIAASRRNADATRKEPGCVRFDFHRAHDDPSRFLLYEVYRSEAGFADHQKTPHYLAWKETVAPLMAVPRSAVKLESLSPDPWT